MIAAFLANRYFDHVVIVSTTILGAYCLIRGLSCYFGHYYNEFIMAKMIKDGLLEEIDQYYWCYVGAFGFFCLVGGSIQ